jgi:hypothetical protein
MVSQRQIALGTSLMRLEAASARSEWSLQEASHWVVISLNDGLLSAYRD